MTSLDKLRELSAKATEGPFYVGDDAAEDTIPHKNSGLALIDTGRQEDWPIARLQEWHNANFLCELANWYRANEQSLIDMERDAGRLDYLEQEAGGTREGAPLALFRRNMPITRGDLDAAIDAGGKEGKS